MGLLIMQSKTTIVNVRDSPFDVYIGRLSKWGNPFKIGIDGTREEVISKYEAHIMTHPTLINELSELVGKTLGCHCKPLPCHGDILVRMIEDKIWLK